VQLYVMRHGSAVDREEWDGDDAGRPLTEDGRAELEKAAQGLRWLAPKVAVVVTSPLTRALETAEPVAQALGVPLNVDAALAPGCNLQTLAPLLFDGRDLQGILVVGHEPDLSELVGILIAGHSLARIAMKKGACCRLDMPSLAKLEHEREVRRLAGRATLRWLITAPQLARLGTPGLASDDHEDGDAEESAAMLPSDSDDEQSEQSLTK